MSPETEPDPTTGAARATAATSGTWPAPGICSVCGDDLVIERLRCEHCTSELTGRFTRCSFCALGDADRQLLEVFLTSGGNLKEVERHLGVSYPTARARYNELLAKLRLRASRQDPYAHTLDALAEGEIDIDEAERRLRGARSKPPPNGSA